MDPYDQYLADVQYEDYLRRVQAEDVDGAIQRTAGQSRLGADYSQSVGSNAIKGLVDFPKAALHMGGDLVNLVNIPSETGGPWDVMRNAGAEKTLNTVGSLSSGIAGAGVGAPAGAWLGGSLGSFLGPLGTAAGAGVGGLAGGALGFGAGLLGFDMTRDAATGGVQNLRPADEYAKDLAYNSSQAVPFGVIGEGVRAIPSVRRLASETGPAGQETANSKVVAYLDKLEPGWAEKLNEKLPGLEGQPLSEHLSTGEILNSFPLKSEQRALGNTGSAEFGRAAEANQLRNADQLKYLNEIEQSTASAGDVQTAIQEGIAQRQAASQRGLTSAEDAVREQVGNLPPVIDQVDAGTIVRPAIAKNLLAQRGRVTAGFEGAGNAVVDRAMIANTINAEMPKYFREVGQQPNGELTRMVEALTREGEPVGLPENGLVDSSGNALTKEPVVTVRDLQAARSKAIEIQKTGDPRSAGVAGKIINAIDQTLSDAVESGSLSAKEKSSLSQGISERNKQGRIFENTPAAQVLDTNYSGSPVVQDSAVMSKFWRSGKNVGAREAVQNYYESFGRTPEAMDTLHRYATNSFRDAAIGADGLVNVKNAQTWLKNHAEALTEAPQLRELLGSTKRAQEFLNDKFGELKRSQAEVENGALKLWLRDIEPSIAIKKMLSGDRAVQQTRATVNYLKANSPEALAGLRRGMIEHLKNEAYTATGEVSIAEGSLPNGKPFDGAVSDAMLTKIWDEQIKPAVEKSGLYTDAQLKMFDVLYKNKTSQMSVGKAKMPGEPTTAQNLSVLSKIMEAASGNFLSHLPGGSFLKIVKPVLMQIPKVKFKATLEQALLNPRFARDLANKATAKNVARTANQIFREEISQALGVGSLAKTGLQNAPVVESNQNKRSPARTFPKQQSVTSKKSFPTPQELLKPPVNNGYGPRRISFDTSNLAPETQAQIGVESSGNPRAVSKKGAFGLMQLMPETAQEIASELGETYMPLTEGMTPEQQQASMEQNVRFGEHYYQKMLGKKYANGNKTLAWAAYNAGPGRLQEAIAMAGTSRDTSKVMSNMPNETQDYVKRVMSRLNLQG